MSGRGKGKLELSLSDNHQPLTDFYLFFFQVEKVLAKVVPNVIVKYFEIIFKVNKRVATVSSLD